MNFGAGFIEREDSRFKAEKEVTKAREKKSRLTADLFAGAAS